MADNGSSNAKHFVLIHGACQGAWCWYKLVHLLQEAGHKVTALDLAAVGTNQEQLKNLHTIDDYHRPLYSFMEALSPDDKVILVGHSMGGYAVSSAMERFPEKIAVAVFLAAYMPGPDLTVDQIGKRFKPGPDYYIDSVHKTSGAPGDLPTTILFGHKFLTTKVYQKSPPEDLKLATLTQRPTKFYNDEESKRQLFVSKEKYGSVRRAYIIPELDYSILVDVQRWMIEHNPPDVTKEVKEADHMVMLSKPQELCTNLMEIIFKLDKNAPMGLVKRV